MLVATGKLIRTLSSPSVPVNLPLFTAKSRGPDTKSSPRKSIPVPLALYKPPDPRSPPLNSRVGFSSVREPSAPVKFVSADAPPAE